MRKLIAAVSLVAGIALAMSLFGRADALPPQECCVGCKDGWYACGCAVESECGRCCVSPCCVH